MLIAASIDHNMTTEVRTGGGFMASEIFTPDVLYSSVIHSFEYHSAIHWAKLESRMPLLHHCGSNVTGALG